MRFSRHGGIYRSDVLFGSGRGAASRSNGPGLRYRARREEHALPIVPDEFRSAIPQRVARQHCPSPLRRQAQNNLLALLAASIYHRAVAQCLDCCLSAGAHPTYPEHDL
jgi:hypothetical protein